MKTNRTIGLALALAVSQWLAAPSGRAQAFYRASVSLVCTSTNATGGVTHRILGNRDFIRQCAREHGLTNLTGLALLYNRTDNALQVVSGTNRVLLCTPLSFSGGVSVSNTNQTKIERLEFVFAGAGTVANGTLAATESYRYGSSNQVSAFSLTGRLQYAVPAEGTNRPAIYTGSLLAGSGFFFGFGCDGGFDRDDHDSDFRFGSRDRD